MMRDTRGSERLLWAAALVAAVGLAGWGCQNNGDPVAPTDSTISVSANPQTVIVPAGGGSGTSEITATLRSKNGTRLPDQEITFSTSGGTLDPAAETPLVTNKDGQATCILTTTSAATITARSGGISGMTQVQTAPGNLAPFQLAVTPQELTGCNDTLTLIATVLTTTGDPVQNILVIFDEVPPSTLSGNFAPGAQVLSNAMGIAQVTWTPSATVCAKECQAATADPNDPTPGACTLFFTARDTTGNFESVEQQITDNIP